MIVIIIVMRKKGAICSDIGVTGNDDNDEFEEKNGDNLMTMIIIK